MRVRHFGNTANNAFHNVQLLATYEAIESELPIRMFGLGHAISAPAWEGADFEVPDAAWVAHPDWAMIPDAMAVNAEYSDLALADESSESTPEQTRSGGVSAAVSAARGRLFGPLRQARWAQPLVELRDRQLLSQRSILVEDPQHINLLYGSASMFTMQTSRTTATSVCMEHGTVRWIADGTRQEKAFRDAYRAQVRRSPHLWVTNTDPRTLEVAEDVAPGRWSAFPHPFMPDSRVPFAESVPQRKRLLSETKSQFVVLLPSSQNWSPHHDKGSKKALSAFVELRQRGVDVGLVAIEWGLQVDESKRYLADAGLSSNVVWMPPLARLALQRMMANVDVVWDQFGMEVFGALALRAVEQGTPLVSRGLAAVAEQLIGGAVPWSQAASTDEIVHETTKIFEEIGRVGRNAVIAETRARYRGWLFERHSPALTAALQREVYSSILDGTFTPGSLPRDEWARRVGSETSAAGAVK